MAKLKKAPKRIFVVVVNGVPEFAYATKKAAIMDGTENFNADEFVVVAYVKEEK